MSKQPNYGFPCVEDPNDFIPDSESCSPQEIATHKLACQTFGKPDHKPNVGCADLIDPETGQWVGHVTRTSWGIGTNLIASCDGCNMPAFGEPLITCHECGGPEYCEECWPKHEKGHDEAVS